MKRKKIIIAVSLSLVLLIVLFNIYFFVIKVPSSSSVYTKSVNSIVEIKCITEDVAQSYGTAEIISKDGKIITNRHVVTYIESNLVTEYEEYYIRFAHEEDYRKATLIYYDTQIDLAMLKIDELPKFDLTPIRFGDSSKIKAGDKVYAIGNTQNYGISITQGIISIPLIKIEYEGKTSDTIQCDLTIAEGNSGGALLNDRGRLIGITTFRTKDSKGQVVYGFAYCIPSNIIKEFIKKVSI